MIQRLDTNVHSTSSDHRNHQRVATMPFVRDSDLLCHADDCYDSETYSGGDEDGIYAYARSSTRQVIYYPCFSFAA